ncbi:dienelactone hydrolase [Rhodococcus sp. Leaf7]|uniref:dienelactone hydrolase family protein n=1 Tax=unclassified Rhodococcus (in: high G+C Gram-positive bacteria) TaxID=192944 RepID=UPI0006F94F62|nr:MULTISPECIES: dienelactone hydrolase family protein [unclassified Rhodococcus (in: high G+C Gram-positive bacteria)]KQU06668.1 dienelactone hydrolase [Rhodococcus sp. Leaf7]KQU42188.1 dienelactone hydrolase [Rhodococcus sp. Leaf247]
MVAIAVFHSVLGVRRGIRDAADHLRDAGHDVTVVDQYEGRSFDDYDSARAFASDIGFPALMQRALTGVSHLSDGFALLGFSNGGGMATFVATRRRVSGAVLCSGALPLEMIDVHHWPERVPVQLHYAVDDPFKAAGSVESVMESVNAAGAPAEYFQYPGSGHLFTDVEMPGEFDPEATAQFWTHVDRFVSSAGAPVHSTDGGEARD